MDRIRTKSRLTRTRLVVFGAGDTCAIDQTPSQSFNVDPATGRPMEEITKVMHMQTAAEQQNAYMNLAVFKGDFLPDETSAKTALKYMKPRLCQLPSELAEWQDGITSSVLDEKSVEDSKKEIEAILSASPEVEKQVVEPKSD